LTQGGIVRGFHPQTKIYSDSLTGWDFAERFGWVILLFPSLDGEGNNRVTPTPSPSNTRLRLGIQVHKARTSPVHFAPSREGSNLSTPHPTLFLGEGKLCRM